MSKRQFKAQASSSRAAFTGSSAAFGSITVPNFGSSSSSLSYINEVPDLSAISNANTVVAFKNLSKRDSTTKAKALEDLQALLADTQIDIDDGVLEAWVNIYPRTSIDNSLRVRQLAHTVQGQISIRSGKRIAKHMSKIVGPWLAGLFDNDKRVAKTAADALQQIFITPEKRHALWTAYQKPILEYCRGVFDKESPQTLSDERSVSPDEANAKYYRVVTAAIGLLSSLIANLKEEEFIKNISEYQDMLHDKKLWEKALSEDPAVRRSIHKLLRSLLESSHSRGTLDFTMLSTIYLYKGLESDQAGSASNYLDTIISLTEFDASIWIDRWTGKKPPHSRLRHFVKRGSQGAPLNYWSSLAKLFSMIPKAALPTDSADAQDLLKAFHSGVINKNEPRAYAAGGLQAYVQVSSIFCAELSDNEKVLVLKETVLPLILQYMNPVAENSKWDVPKARSNQVVGEAMRSTTVINILEQKWPDLSTKLVGDIRLSLPEASSEYRSSQDKLSERGDRFATVLSLMLDKQPSLRIGKVLDESVAQVVNDALQVCEDRNGKPYGAAAIVAAIIQKCKQFCIESPAISRILSNFSIASLARIYVSPSYKQVAGILFALNDQEFFSPAWNKSLKATVTASSEWQFPALQELLVERKHVSESEMEKLGLEMAPVILGEVDNVLRHSRSWDFIVAILSRSAIVSNIFGDEILLGMTNALSSSIPSEVPKSLEGFQRIAKSAPGLLKAFLGRADGKRLLSDILLLTESPDDRLSSSASNLNADLHSLLSDVSTTIDSEHGMVNVVHDGLEHAGPGSVSIETLLNQARGLVQANTVQSLALLLPSTRAWSAALGPFLSRPVEKSFAITSPLTGAVYLISPDSPTGAMNIERDTEGMSVPLRMALYTCELLQTVPEVQQEVRPELLQLLVVTMQLANDNLSVVGSTNIWSDHTVEMETEMTEFVSTCQALITSRLREAKDWRREDTPSENQALKGTVDLFFSAASGRSAWAYYNAQAYCTLVAELIEIHGWQNRHTPDIEKQLQLLQKANDPLRTASYLVAYKEPFSSSTVASRYCNNLAADLDALDIANKPDVGLQKLVLLNSIIQNQQAAVETIAKPRLIRYVSRFAGWLADESMSDEIWSEICRVLSALLPQMSDMYGNHWSNVVSNIKDLWESVNKLPEPSGPSLVPAVHASLKLYNVLGGMKKREESKSEDERNDDLTEALRDAEPDMASGLLQLLKVPRETSDETNQPLRIVNNLLMRQVSSIPQKYLKGVQELFPQLYAQSRSVQQAAFDVLHEDIPRRQEQVSVDTILEKTTAQLPDELLSLILEAPSMAELSNVSFERTIPISLRGYLFSWMLIFDHFQNASFKVKNDYVESIKEGGYVNNFLDFTFDFLGHNKGKPVDVSKFDITTYAPDLLDSPLKDTQWFLTHLYYLCLTNLPTLSKTWWFECKSRQTSISVESWTSKFIAPHVISNALGTVSSWSSAQDPSPGTDEPPPLVIKVNPRASELTASYPMDDEQSATIIINLPPSFPLQQATVTSPSKRIGLDERRWNSWLRTAQGVIAFSNNSIVDGLLSWRRNVFGALKGQTECAICYSVVGEDGKLPSKKCRTCKNSFHGNCLYKWFKSANNTTCPLCRNSFNYG